MIQLTQRDLQHAYDQVSSAHRLISGHRSKGESIARNAVTALEVLAGTAVSGVVAGRFGAPYASIAGHTLPLDLAGGIALHGAAFFGLFGNYGDHIHNFATGVMSQYVTRASVAYGAHMREKAGLPRVSGLVVGSQLAVGARIPHGNMPGTAGATVRHGNMPGTSTGYDYRRHGNMPGTGGAVRRAPLTAAELAAMASRAR